MRHSRFSQLVFRAGFAASTSLMVVLAVACGGDKPDAKTPGSSSGMDPMNGASSGGTNEPSGTSSGSPSASSSASPTPVGNSSTTTQLGDGGDLQGAKLGGKMHSETMSVGDGGPRSTGGQSAGEPGRTLADINTIVKSRRDEARACYDKAVAAHPGIEGNLDIKWTIDPQGNVTDAALDSSKSQILEPSVANCVIDVIKKIKFAASPKGFETHAHYPFDFHPKTFTPKTK